jgi:hypothetical protein
VKRRKRRKCNKNQTEKGGKDNKKTETQKGERRIKRRRRN